MAIEQDRPDEGSTAARPPGQDAGASRVQADLAELRELIAKARSMPMSASCVINRAEALAVVDRAIAALPAELAAARSVIDSSRSQIARAEAEANRIIEQARESAADLASHSSVMKLAEEEAGRIRSQAAEEAAALRKETDAFIDERMASFESVLHKTTSQVRTARHRLAERSGLDDRPED